MRTSKKSFCFALLALSLCSRALPLTHHSSFVINSFDETNQLCLNFCTIILRNEVTIDRTAGKKMVSPSKIASLCGLCDTGITVLATYRGLAVLLAGKASSSFCLILTILVSFFFEWNNGVPSHSDQSRNTRLQDVRLEREWACQMLVGECLLPEF
jgi:hypothetical protein